MRDFLYTTRDGIDLRPVLCQGCQARRGHCWCLLTDAAGTQPAWPFSRVLGWISPLRFTETMVHPLSSSCSSEMWGNPTGKRAGTGFESCGEERRPAGLPALGLELLDAEPERRNVPGSGMCCRSAFGISSAEPEHCFSWLQ